MTIKTWASSDLHFGHGNIIKYSPRSRGHFADVNEMNNAIISNFNSVVGDDDVIFLLGDIGFCKPEMTLRFLSMMNGKKFIVFGNHDSKLMDHKDFKDESVRRTVGIIGSDKEHKMTHTVDGVKHRIHMFHHPIESWDSKGHGSLHFFGHCHTPKEQNKPRNRSIDVGVDGNDLFPHNVDDLCRQLRSIEIRDIRY